MREACVNDLEAPAFRVMPELEKLKQRLVAEGLYEAVFMTGAHSLLPAFFPPLTPLVAVLPRLCCEMLPAVMHALFLSRLYTE